MSSRDDRARRMAWGRARAKLGQDPAQVRADDHERVMCWDDYLNPLSETGWRVALIVPEFLGGRDEPANRRAVAYATQAMLEEAGLA